LIQEYDLVDWFHNSGPANKQGIRGFLRRLQQWLGPKRNPAGYALPSRAPEPQQDQHFPKTGGSSMQRTLNGISDIRRFFHRNERPMFFISATNFNLLGIDEWVRNFHYISYVDCYDGAHPNVFVPTEITHPEFESIEDINNYLL
jgi:hypothetical protein